VATGGVGPAGGVPGRGCGLTFRSGYTNFITTGCANLDSEEPCAARGTNGVQTAANIGKSLQIRGTFGAKPANTIVAWSGVLWSPKPQMFVAGDASASKEFRFWVRGDSGTYQFMVYVQRKGNTPTIKSFGVDGTWREIVLPWSEFGTDAHDLLAVIIATGPKEGPFTVQLDGIRLR